MKRCDIKRRLYHLRIRKNRVRRRSRKYSSKNKRYLKADAVRLTAPRRFELIEEQSRQNLLAFIRDMWEVAYTNKKNLVIDFSHTTKLVADGALLFRSELCALLLNVDGNVSITCEPPRDNKICQVLEQIEVFKLLGYYNKVIPCDEDVIHWRIAQGMGAEGEKYEPVLGRYDGFLPEQLRQGLFVGVTEAMTNCAQHAYIMPRSEMKSIEFGSTKWWMFSQHKDDYLYVAFCDLGIGIPKSLPLQRPAVFEYLLKAIKRVNDAELIRGAIESSLSRTKKEHRGKGLRQLLSVLDGVSGAQLCIHSNKGCYTLVDSSEKLFNFSDSIRGTLIGWKIPLHTNDETALGESSD